MPLIDILILFLVVISALMAMLRGFVKEILTIIAWVAAIAITITFSSQARSISRDIIVNTTTADIAAFAVLFLITIIPLLLFFNLLGQRLGCNEPGLIDRMAGFGFGLVRGLFIITLVYWTHMLVTGQSSEPEWIEDAYFLPIIKTIARILPQNLNENEILNKGDISEENQNDQKQQSISESESDDYLPTERQRLEDLITGTTQE